MEMPSILSLGCGDMNDGPDVGFAVVIAHEHGNQFEDIDAVCLQTAVAALDVDGRGVDDEVVAGRLGVEEAMDPEAVTAGFEARYQRDGVVETEATVCDRDLSLQSLEVTCGNVTDAWLVAETGAEGELPRAVGEFEGEIEGRRLGKRRMSEAGRRGHDAPPLRNDRSMEE